MSRNAILANPEHYLFKIFPREHTPQNALKHFSRHSVAPKIILGWIPPQKKILDRTLYQLLKVAWNTYVSAFHFF